MNYDLAKELKDAGFSIGGTKSYYIGSICGLLETEHDDKCNDYDCHVEYQDFPESTLEELIEACPPYIFEEEFNLHATHEEGKIEWVAGYISPLNLTGKLAYLSLGSTPAEAVARLWLVLNKTTPTTT